jgi:hypothetical protein
MAYRSNWRKPDPLYRGDGKDGVRPPHPTADPSIVRHILYLGGYGRETPYHSTSELRETAAHFAGKDGAVYSTTVERALSLAVRHIPRLELLGLLRGKGRGAAKGRTAYEVLLARKYVEQWSEHLLDYRGMESSEAGVIVGDLFDRR